MPLDGIWSLEIDGISLGSTATAMTNMTAVNNHYGPSRLAFLIVPLVCAYLLTWSMWR